MTLMPLRLLVLVTLPLALKMIHLSRRQPLGLSVVEFSNVHRENLTLVFEADGFRQQVNLS